MKSFERKFEESSCYRTGRLLALTLIYCMSMRVKATMMRMFHLHFRLTELSLPRSLRYLEAECKAKAKTIHTKLETCSYI